MGEYEKIAEISYVTDTENNQVKMGEVEGAFNQDKLKNYIKTYGHEQLCAQLGYMQFQVWKTLREVNGEKDHGAKDCATNIVNES